MIEVVKDIVIIIGAIFVIYMGLPSLWYRNFSRITIRSMINNEVAITFDDGPDEFVTPQLLGKLSKLNQKVTFFVVGSSALKYPNIIKKALKEGHRVELHSMAHQCHWLMGPRRTFDDIRQCVEGVKSLGGNPQLYRPPWGLYNLFTVLACKKYGLRCVHWSIHAYDWRVSTTTEEIIEGITQKVRPGNIILLHDGRGADHAPKRTLAAITSICHKINSKGLNNTVIKTEGRQ